MKPKPRKAVIHDLKTNVYLCLTYIYWKKVWVCLKTHCGHAWFAGKGTSFSSVPNKSSQ